MTDGHGRLSVNVGEDGSIEFDSYSPIDPCGNLLGALAEVFDVQFSWPQDQDLSLSFCYPKELEVFARDRSAVYAKQLGKAAKRIGQERLDQLKAATRDILLTLHPHLRGERHEAELNSKVDGFAIQILGMDKELYPIL